MTFKIGDYLKHKEHPKSKVIIHIENRMFKDIINAQAYNYGYATEIEIENYHMELNSETALGD